MSMQKRQTAQWRAWCSFVALWGSIHGHCRPFIALAVIMRRSVSQRASGNFIVDCDLKCESIVPTFILIKMLGLRRLIPRFAFSTWWGEKKLLDYYLKKDNDNSVPKEQWNDQLSLLRYKASNSFDILQMLYSQQTIKDKISSQTFDQAKLLAPKILKSLEQKKMREAANSDYKEVLDEVIQMFNPRSGHLLDRDIYSQERFNLKEDGQIRIAYNPNPLLSSDIIQKMRQFKSVVLIGSPGIGKSIQLTLISELFQTVSRNNWIQSGQNAVSKDNLPTFKIELPLQILLHQSEGSVYKLKVSLTLMKQLVYAIKDLMAGLLTKNLRLCIIVDQINAYFSIIRRLHQISCQMCIQKVHLKRSQSQKAKFEALIKAQTDEQVKSFLIMSYISGENYDTSKLPRKLPKQLQELKEEYQTLLEKETKLRPFLKQLVDLKPLAKLFNSSRTIQNYLQNFCEANNFFYFKSHEEAQFYTFPYERTLLETGGQNHLTRSCWQQIVSVTKKEAFLKCLMNYKSQIYQHLTADKWPIWARYLTIRKVLKPLTPQLNQILQEHEVLKNGKNDSEEENTLKRLKNWAQKLRENIDAYSKLELQNNLKKFAFKGGTEEVYFKIQIFKVIYSQISSQVHQSFKKHCKTRQIDFSNAQERRKFENNLQKRSFTVDIKHLSNSLPLFAWAQKKLLDDQEIWWQQFSSAYRSKFLKYSEVMGQCQIFQKKGDYMHVYSTFSDLHSLQHVLKPNWQLIMYYEAQFHQVVVGKVWDTFISRALRFPARGFTLQITSERSEDSIYKHFFSDHVVFFESIQNAKKRRTINKKNEPYNSAKNLQQVLRKAYENPKGQIFSLPVDKKSVKQIPQIAPLNVGFDLLIAQYNPQEQLLECWPIDWGISWNLAKDSSPVITAPDTKGSKMVEWWNNQFNNLKTVIQAIYGKDIKVKFYFTVAGPQSVFKVQSNKLNELQNYRKSKKNDPTDQRFEALKPTKRKPMEMSLHVANVQSMQFKDFNSTSLQVIRLMLRSISQSDQDIINGYKQSLKTQKSQKDGAEKL